MKNRNHYVKRFAAWATALVLMLTGVIGFAVAESRDEPFSQWNAEAPALKALTEYVEDVTNEASPNYIPPVDRIATFDMDGTLMGELFPTYLEVMLLTERILKDPLPVRPIRENPMNLVSINKLHPLRSV